MIEEDDEFEDALDAIDTAKMEVDGIVHPSDSISTRAVSVTVTPSLWSPHGSSEGSRIESVPEDKVLLNTVQSSRSPHPIPVCSYNKMSPTGPPPTHPPPPLPFRDRGYSNPWDPRSPPPLPPRNPSVRLPDPVAAELVSRLSRIDDESSFHTPIAGTSTDNVVPNLLISRSQRVSTNSTDSIPSVSGETGSGRRRGHTKTNSLDRGLTLAKSLKNVDNQQLESIASESSSISSPSSEHSKKKSKQVITEKGEVREKLVADKKELQENGCNSVITKVIHDIFPVNKLLLIKMNLFYVFSIGLFQETTVKCFSNETSPDFCMPSSSLCSPIDPITRDVERRMSMKRDGNLTSDRTSEDGRSDRFSNTRSSIGHAKSLARNYSSFASGLFKGAFQKVMSAAHGRYANTFFLSNRCFLFPPYANRLLILVAPLQKLLRMIHQKVKVNSPKLVQCTHYFAYDRYQQKTDGCSSASDVFESTMSNMESFRPPSSSESNTNSESVYDDNDVACLVSTKPFAVFKGHTADILDLSWSKNYFILSSGMDRTVKLWHLSRSECLCCFQHVDFVTCVAFLPKVKFITAITFVKNGKFAVVGTYNGRCYFYTTDVR
uniref:WD repeat-containing protein 44 n=1 Tax=Heterorhabditis bacteriophora TaxID=37862 RepID=A0A1I7WPM3_HETBA